jgi:hypothetical protein
LKAAAVVLIVSLVSSALPARAEDAIPPEPERGTEELVTGIVLTSALPAVGGVLLLGSLMSFCGLDDEEDDGGDDGDCRRRSDRLAGAGLILTAVGVGVGVPLIVSGAKQKKRWKEWNRQYGEGAKDRAERRRHPTYAAGLGFVDGRPAALLTVALP